MTWLSRSHPTSSTQTDTEYKESERKRTVDARIVNTLRITHYLRTPQHVPCLRQSIRVMERLKEIQVKMGKWGTYIFWSVSGTCAALVKFPSHLRILSSALLGNQYGWWDSWRRFKWKWANGAHQFSKVSPELASVESFCFSVDCHFLLLPAGVGRVALGARRSGFQPFVLRLVAKTRQSRVVVQGPGPGPYILVSRLVSSRLSSFFLSSF